MSLASQSSPSQRIFDLFSDFAADSFATAQGFQEELSDFVKIQIESLVQRLSLVTKEELGVLQDQVNALYAENESLKERIRTMEATQSGKEQEVQKEER